MGLFHDSINEVYDTMPRLRCNKEELDVDLIPNRQRLQQLVTIHQPETKLGRLRVEMDGWSVNDHRCHDMLCRRAPCDLRSVGL